MQNSDASARVQKTADTSETSQQDADTARAQIDRYRVDIDTLDQQLVSLINERQALSLAIRQLKPRAGMKLFDAGREDAIFAKVAALNNGPLTDEGLVQIYKKLLEVMKRTPDTKDAQ